MGTEDGTKGYRLYNPRNRRIVTPRDVVFEESKSWAWNEEIIGESLTIPYWTNVLAQDTNQSHPAKELQPSEDVNASPLTLINTHSHASNFGTNYFPVRESSVLISPADGSRETPSKLILNKL